MVRSPLTAARATFALKAGEWFRRGRLLMVSPVHGDYRCHQAEIPLIALSTFPRPALSRAFLLSAVGVNRTREENSDARQTKNSFFIKPAIGQLDAQFLGDVDHVLNACF